MFWETGSNTWNSSDRNRENVYKTGKSAKTGKPTDNITELSYLLWHLNSLSSSTLLLQDNALCWLCWWLILLSTTQVCSPLHAEPLEETNRQTLHLGMRLLSTYSFTALITIDPTRNNCQTAMPTVELGIAGSYSCMTRSCQHVTGHKQLTLQCITIVLITVLQLYK